MKEGRLKLDDILINRLTMKAVGASVATLTCVGVTRLRQTATLSKTMPYGARQKVVDVSNLSLLSLQSTSTAARLEAFETLVVKEYMVQAISSEEEQRTSFTSFLDVAVEVIDAVDELNLDLKESKHLGDFRDIVRASKGSLSTLNEQHLFLSELEMVLEEKNKPSGSSMMKTIARALLSTELYKKNMEHFQEYKEVLAIVSPKVDVTKKALSALAPTDCRGPKAILAEACTILTTYAEKLPSEYWKTYRAQVREATEAYAEACQEFLGPLDSGLPEHAADVIKEISEVLAEIALHFSLEAWPSDLQALIAAYGRVNSEKQTESNLATALAEFKEPFIGKEDDDAQPPATSAVFELQELLDMCTDGVQLAKPTLSKEVGPIIAIQYEIVSRAIFPYFAI